MHQIQHTFKQGCVRLRNALRCIEMHLGGYPVPRNVGQRSRGTLAFLAPKTLIRPPRPAASSRPALGGALGDAKSRPRISLCGLTSWAGRWGCPGENVCRRKAVVAEKRSLCRGRSCTYEAHTKHSLSTCTARSPASARDMVRDFIML